MLAARIAATVCQHLQAMQDTRPRLLTVKQAAVYLGRTENALRLIAARGALATVRANSRVMFDVQDLDRWIEANKQGPD